MKKFGFILILLLFPGNLWADAARATVRIISHHLSGVVITSGPGGSYVLTSAHGWAHETKKGLVPNQQLLAKPITLDAPDPISTDQIPRGLGKRVGNKLVAIDYNRDLALVHVPAQLPYVCPVAPAGYRYGQKAISIGYDQLQLPAKRFGTVILVGQSPDPELVFTKEPPWHGRSGGALADARTGELIGVVAGYNFEGRGPRPPFDPRQYPREYRQWKDTVFKQWVMQNAQGRYVSHEAIMKFLGSAVAKGKIPDQQQVQLGISLKPLPPTTYRGTVPLSQIKWNYRQGVPLGQSVGQLRPAPRPVYRRPVQRKPAYRQWQYVQPRRQLIYRWPQRQVKPPPGDCQT